MRNKRRKQINFLGWGDGSEVKNTYALVEDQSSVANSHAGQLTTQCFWPLRAPAHIHTYPHTDTNAYTKS